jgi:acetylornithine deacetylase/succinyl-diaminopimelate desuccinylase-like protein
MSYFLLRSGRLYWNYLLLQLECQSRVKDLLPFETSKDDLLVQGLRSTFVDTLGTEPEVSTMNAWLDGSWIYHFAEAPTVSFGAGKEETAHADVEYIVIEDMKNCAKVLARFLYRQLRRQ